jgi:phosphoglycerate dehydrogenase-like enzyme
MARVEGEVVGPRGDGARAEQVLGLVLACRKELPLLLRADTWDPQGKQRGRLLHGAHVVLVGRATGGRADAPADALADAVAAVLAPTGARVTRTDGLDAGAATDVDVLVLLPGATRVGADVLAALPENASVVDACAPDAPAVDLDALTAGLAVGRPLHVAVVTAAPATVPAGHALWASPRALIVPLVGPLTVPLDAGAPA